MNKFLEHLKQQKRSGVLNPEGKEILVSDTVTLEKKWVLTFLLEESSYESFEQAFKMLQEKWNALPGKSMQLVETIWIKNPNTNRPMFYKDIVKAADALNLP